MRRLLSATALTRFRLVSCTPQNAEEHRSHGLMRRVLNGTDGRTRHFQITGSAQALQACYYSFPNFPPGEPDMPDLSRRQFLAGTAATAAAVTAGAPFVQAQKRGGTMRFIPHADLKVLDPIWTTAYITRNHSYMIYDTLFGTDEKLQIKPQMVDKWSS